MSNGFFKNFLKKISKINILLIINVLLIFILSLSTIYSATLSKSSSFFKKEIIWFIIAFLVFLFISFIDYRKYSKYSSYLYIFNLLLLVSVLVFGTKRLGARRWLDLGPITIQPSEFAKLFLILTFSAFLVKNYSEKYMGFKSMFISFLHIFPVFFLILIEPDLGTSLVVILVYGVLLFLNRLDWKCIVAVFLSVFFFLPFAYKFLLKEYQRNRVNTFLSPENDALGTGWNISQSKIAIGSGQIYGKGFMNNTQGKLRFLPESHTDFIGSVFLEERGFIGGSILILLYIFLLAQIIYIADTTEDQFGKLICYGIATIFFFHIFVNLGMIMGIMPVTGLPLLLMSYGGSSLVFSFLMLGVVQSVKIHRGIK
ncbi:MAG: rod shape-determining protein RodA [Fusobacterium sp.]|uniref:rod shape-determining protein RodA n=1 Tax=Fusobacterium sp. TaxID=68766 RepID=UPI0026DD9F32|nr:rod shape-determining protein RodA [Fusobacterium sp.]MDO4690696.1 rod shape-determining protein RodA [Fusobacterium sp.]